MTPVEESAFKSGLEIVSPGGLPRGMAIDRMKTGCSRCRNKAIAMAFSYMRVAEKWGLGVPNVMQQFAERGLSSPEYVDWGNAIKVVLARTNAENVKGVKKKWNIGDEKRNIEDEKRNIEKVKAALLGFSAPTVNNVLKLYSVFETKEYFRRKDIVDALSLSVSSANRLLAAMSGRSLVEPVVGRGKGAYRWAR